MRVYSITILFFGCIFFVDEVRSQLGGLGNAVQAANTANQLNQATGGGADKLIEAVPKCDAPEDHSCDDKSFSDIADKVTGGGMFSGAQTGLLGPAAGLTGRRRRRGIFGGAKPAGLLHKAAPAKALNSNPLNNPALPNHANPAANGIPKDLGNVPGTSLLKDPMSTNAISGKLKKCDERNGPNGQFTKMAPSMDQIMSGNFQNVKMSPSQIDAAKLCKDTMKTDQQQCQMLKRQACAFINGKVTNPSQMSCMFKDVVKTQGEIKAKNTGCDTAGAIMKDPSHAGNTLQNGAGGIAAGLGAGMAADKIAG